MSEQQVKQRVVVTEDNGTRTKTTETTWSFPNIVTDVLQAAADAFFHFGSFAESKSKLADLELKERILGGPQSGDLAQLRKELDEYKKKVASQEQAIRDLKRVKSTQQRGRDGWRRGETTGSSARDNKPQAQTTSNSQPENNEAKVNNELGVVGSKEVRINTQLRDQLVKAPQLQQKPVDAG